MSSRQTNKRVSGTTIQHTEVMINEEVFNVSTIVDGNGFVETVVFTEEGKPIHEAKTVGTAGIHRQHEDAIEFCYTHVAESISR